ncbi:MAG: sigma-70 family RNA polymerase sigma factor [Oscillospiraceae bacterium]|nr:sigma-70 family RNA polymerase sigma factor [Oscillospiraceae bacterium]
MEDTEIVALYWARNEAAIPATAEKYGPYCTTVALRILPLPQDAEECVNDTWLRTWNAVPPQRPALLRPFLAKITRNLAFDRYREATARKRGGGELPLALEELGECVSDRDTEGEALAHELSAAIDAFLRALPRRERSIFLRRYFYVDSCADIARRFGLRESTVRVQLHRTRAKLRDFLREEGLEP